MQGIYQIRNTVTGMLYVGHSGEVLQRMAQHRSDLRRECHPNERLQHSFDKYGATAFEYSEIVCGPFGVEDLVELEQFYIDKYRAEGKDVCNFLPAAGNKGVPHSIEARRKMSKNRVGKYRGIRQSQEHIQKRAEARKGWKPSEETRHKISQSLLNRSLSL